MRIRDLIAGRSTLWDNSHDPATPQARQMVGHVRAGESQLPRQLTRITRPIKKRKEYPRPRGISHGTPQSVHHAHPGSKSQHPLTLQCKLTYGQTRPAHGLNCVRRSLNRYQSLGAGSLVVGRAVTSAQASTHLGTIRSSGSAPSAASTSGICTTPPPRFRKRPRTNASA
jgi:hypothetical protein